LQRLCILGRYGAIEIVLLLFIIIMKHRTLNICTKCSCTRCKNTTYKH